MKLFNIKLTEVAIREIKEYLDRGTIDIDGLLMEICDQARKQKEEGNEKNSI